MQEVFGFVKRNLSEAWRRKDAVSGERGADSLPFSQVFVERWCASEWLPSAVSSQAELAELIAA